MLLLLLDSELLESNRNANSQLTTIPTRHADSRERFNMEYQDLMTVKHEYDGHVKQAEMARQSEKKYAALERQHRKYR